MNEPTDCGLLGKKNLGDPNCSHQWNWSGEIITTAPAKQHRCCTLCGRRECVSICKSETRIEDCRDPDCKGHWERNIVELKQEDQSKIKVESPLIMKNGILRYR